MTETNPVLVSAPEDEQPAANEKAATDNEFPVMSPARIDVRYLNVHPSLQEGREFSPRTKPREEVKDSFYFTRKSTNLKTLMDKTRLEDIIPPAEIRRPIVSIDATTKVEDALNTLRDSSIISCPVYEEDELAGLVDMIDFACFLLNAAGDIKLSDLVRVESYANIKLTKAFSLEPVKKVMNFSGRDPLILFKSSETLQAAVLRLALGLHRVAVTNDFGDIQMILSQSTVTKLVYENLDTLGTLGEKTLKNLGIGMKPVKTINENLSAMRGFQMIKTHEVSALAVVDNEGRLTSNLSASDVKGLCRDNFACLILPIRDFLPEKSRKPIVAHPGDTVEMLVSRFVETKVHRMFIVDDDRRPVGVVALTDMMQVFTMDAGSFR